MKASVKTIAGLVAGATLGYLYYYFVGCASGSCPITSHWETTVLFGAFAGAVLAAPSKTRKGEENDGKN